MSLLQDDLAAISATLAAIKNVKVGTPAMLGLTTTLTNLVNLFNSNAPKAKIMPVFSAYIALFNQLTTLTDVLTVQVAKAVADDKAFTVGISNLTDTAVTALDLNPVKDYASAYAVLANVLVFCPDKAAALAIVDKLYADLKADINAYYDAAPDGPTPALLVNSMNALSVVLAA